jgi:hypothetical protein
MTVIRLDDATLAKVVAAGEGPILVCDENGSPMCLLTDLRPVEDEGDEPCFAPAAE